jgi:hypothetical protein
VRVTLEMDGAAAAVLLAQVNRRLRFGSQEATRHLTQRDREALEHARQAIALGIELSTRQAVIHKGGENGPIEPAPV